ncbi:glycosyl transferase [Paenibacillus yonginensis]|uniref:Glycosyl transferase n=1 Tax=Paenibacillus yonginensis TaxID=1462996 RepID=A0A1B1MVU6_9BACL|nr:glycosyltransferase [Paenibacillus yonginensis]ANS73294.1 glycosyl transferase [Paenibacillus yonginensis]
MPDRNKQPALSIIICTYNRAALLCQTLESLKDLRGVEQAEIIVVDNRSTDDTREVAGRFVNRGVLPAPCRYVFEPVQGLSAARNAGIIAAQAELIAFLDDDAIPSAGWLEAILTTFEQRPEVNAMGGKIHPRFESERPGWLSGPFELPYTIVDLGNAVREYPSSMHPYGANMAMRRTVFDEGMFPLELGRKGSLLLSGEETWIFEQIRRSGGKTIYHPEMEVEHFIPSSRLNKEWIMRRYYFQGISNGMKREGFGSTCYLLGKTAAKVLYVSVSRWFARNETARLLNQCRMESIRGTLHTVLSRGGEPGTE